MGNSRSDHSTRNGFESSNYSPEAFGRTPAVEAPLAAFVAKAYDAALDASVVNPAADAENYTVAERELPSVTISVSFNIGTGEKSSNTEAVAHEAPALTSDQHSPNMCEDATNILVPSKQRDNHDSCAISKAQVSKNGLQSPHCCRLQNAAYKRSSPYIQSASSVEDTAKKTMPTKQQESHGSHIRPRSSSPASHDEKSVAQATSITTPSQEHVRSVSVGACRCSPFVMEETDALMRSFKAASALSLAAKEARPILTRPHRLAAWVAGMQSNPMLHGFAINA